MSYRALLHEQDQFKEMVSQMEQYGWSKRGAGGTSIEDLEGQTGKNYPSPTSHGNMPPSPTNGSRQSTDEGRRQESARFAELRRASLVRMTSNLLVRFRTTHFNEFTHVLTLRCHFLSI